MIVNLSVCLYYPSWILAVTYKLNKPLLLDTIISKDSPSIAILNSWNILSIATYTWADILASETHENSKSYKTVLLDWVEVM